MLASRGPPTFRPVESWLRLTSKARVSSSYILYSSRETARLIFDGSFDFGHRQQFQSFGHIEGKQCSYLLEGNNTDCIRSVWGKRGRFAFAHDSSHSQESRNFQQITALHERWVVTAHLRSIRR